MYLHLGQAAMIPEREILGIFDLDITSQSYRTREFLNRAEKAGEVINVSDDLPKSFVLCQERDEPGQRVYLAQPSSATLVRRAERNLTAGQGVLRDEIGD